MAGISDKAIKPKYAENKYRYNEGSELQHEEFSDGTGLELYETSFRSLDPQLGRFAQIDPLADEDQGISCYAYVGNNPVLYNDPTGLKKLPVVQWLQVPNYDGASGLGGGGGDGGASAGGMWDNGVSAEDAAWAKTQADAQAAVQKYASGTPSGAPIVSLQDILASTPKEGAAILTADGTGAFNLVYANEASASYLNPSHFEINYNYTGNVNGQDVPIVGVSLFNVSGQQPGLPDGQQADFPVYGSDNKLIGNVNVNFYNTGGSGGRKGVYVKLNFHSKSGKISNLNWTQRFSDTNPAAGSGLKANTWYNDPQPPDDNLPYYYTLSELPRALTNDGIGFSDFPSSNWAHTINFQLSLVTMAIGGNPGSTLITFQYSYTWANGNATTQPLKQMK
jgi:RHS repeat-associated protein